jgi:hypothetical protein
VYWLEGDPERAAEYLDLAGPAGMLLANCGLAPPLPLDVESWRCEWGLGPDALLLPLIVSETPGWTWTLWVHWFGRSGADPGATPTEYHGFCGGYLLPVDPAARDRHFADSGLLDRYVRSLAEQRRLGLRGFDLDPRDTSKTVSKVSDVFKASARAVAWIIRQLEESGSSATPPGPPPPEPLDPGDPASYEPIIAGLKNRARVKPALLLSLMAGKQSATTAEVEAAVYDREAQEWTCIKSLVSELNRSLRTWDDGDREVNDLARRTLLHTTSGDFSITKEGWWLTLAERGKPLVCMALPI